MSDKGGARRRRKRFEQAADWVLRHREGLRDRPAFEAWLAGDPGNIPAYKMAERMLGEARTAMQGDPALEPPPPKRRRSRAPAVVLLLTGLGGIAFLAAGSPLRLQADVVAGSRDMPELALADGSIVQLNAGSALATAFSASQRKVRLLRGEAYFTVAAEAKRPFVVEAAGGAVTARGTAFDVSLEEAGTDVLVTQHAVDISPLNGGTGAARLEQGQAAYYDASGHVGPVRRIDADAVLAWRRGLLVADDLSMPAVAAALDRHFAGRILVIGGARDRRVSGTFSVIDTDATLALLARSLGLTVTRLGPLIIVRS